MLHGKNEYTQRIEKRHMITMFYLFYSCCTNAIQPPISQCISVIKIELGEEEKKTVTAKCYPTEFASKWTCSNANAFIHCDWKIKIDLICAFLRHLWRFNISTITSTTVITIFNYILLLHYNENDVRSTVRFDCIEDSISATNDHPSNHSKRNNNAIPSNISASNFRCEISHQWFLKDTDKNSHSQSVANGVFGIFM